MLVEPSCCSLTICYQAWHGDLLTSLVIYQHFLGLVLFQFVGTVSDGAADCPGEADDELPGQRQTDRPQRCGRVAQRDPGDVTALLEVPVRSSQGSCAPRTLSSLHLDFNIYRNLKNNINLVTILILYRNCLKLCNDLGHRNLKKKDRDHLLPYIYMRCVPLRTP